MIWRHMPRGHAHAPHLDARHDLGSCASGLRVRERLGARRAAPLAVPPAFALLPKAGMESPASFRVGGGAAIGAAANIDTDRWGAGARLSLAL